MSKRLKPAVLVAGVRFGGAALTALSVIIGLRLLGADAFGVSVILLSLGHLFALPGTALERLVLRLTATGLEEQGARIGTVASRYSLVLLSTCLVAAWPLTSAGIAAPLEILSVGLTGVMATEVSLRQASCRARGKLLWGQAPNELFRPAVTIATYFLVSNTAPKEQWGALSALIPACATLVLIAGAPKVRLEKKSKQNLRTHLAAASMGSFVTIAAVSASIERLYPILAGALSTTSAASVIAVDLRIIQVGLFGQALAIYYFSPAIAASVSADRDVTVRGRSALNRIRLLAASCATPIIVACLVFPAQIQAVVGGLDLEGTLPLVALAICAQVVTGPSQTLLMMSDRGERPVAIVYILGSSIPFILYCSIGTWGAPPAVTAIAVTYTIFAFGQLTATKMRFGHYH